MAPIVATSIADPRLAVYRNLNQSNLTRNAGLFVVEGQTLVERLLESDFETQSVVCGERHVERLATRIPAAVPLYVIQQAMISELVGFRFHRGVLACGRRRSEPTVDAILPRTKRALTIVVCPRILDPTNLGGIVRNCCAFGVDALVLGSGCADPFSRRVVRVSMGAALKLPIAISAELRRDLKLLRRDLGFQIVGTVLDKQAEPLQTASRRDRLALVFGSEGEGLGPEWIELCDRHITVPMQRDTDSLNVAMACGVFLYHFTRQETYQSISLFVEV
jgi:tRNA G18 (ribose-2'-O)-methylase SpoU